MSATSDDSVSEELKQQLANEVARLRDVAVRSSDPVVIAKAIAASDKGVQHVILEKLGGGDRLVEVFALQGSSTTELQVFFRIAAREQVARLVDVGILAFVNESPMTFAPRSSTGRSFVSRSARDPRMLL